MIGNFSVDERVGWKGLLVTTRIPWEREKWYTVMCVYAYDVVIVLDSWLVVALCSAMWFMNCIEMVWYDMIMWCTSGMLYLIGMH